MRELEWDILDQLDWREDGTAKGKVNGCGFAAEWEVCQLESGNYQVELFTWSNWLRATHWQPGEWGNEQQHILEAESVKDIAEMIEEHLPGG